MSLGTSLRYSVPRRSSWRSEQCVIQLLKKCAGLVQHTRPNLTMISTELLMI